MLANRLGDAPNSLFFTEGAFVNLPYLNFFLSCTISELLLFRLPIFAPIYTMGGSKLTGADVAKHDSKNSCWVIVHGKAYDVTEFLPGTICFAILSWA